MPKENTHLFFAHALAGRVSDPEPRRLLADNAAYLSLGCVAPDVFFYAQRPRVEAVSRALHGAASGRPAFTLAETACRVLAEAAAAGRGRDVAFALGFLSHYVLDITFHPVIDALAGNYYDPDPAARRRTMGIHHFLETALDIELNDRCRVGDLVDLGLVPDLVYTDFISRTYAITPRDIMGAWRIFRLANLAFRMPPVHAVVSVLNRLGLVRADHLLPLFYAHARRHAEDLPVRMDDIRYHDPATGGEVRTSASALLDRAMLRGGAVLDAAYGSAMEKGGADRCSDAVRAALDHAG